MIYIDTAESTGGTHTTIDHPHRSDRRCTSMLLFQRMLGVFRTICTWHKNTAHTLLRSDRVVPVIRRQCNQKNIHIWNIIRIIRIIRI